MNCCDDWGKCTQGHNCAARISPAGTPKLQRLCSDLGECNMHPGCLDHATCQEAHQAGVAMPLPCINEAGHATRAHLLREAVILLAGIAICAIVSIASIAAGAGFGG